MVEAVAMSAIATFTASASGFIRTQLAAWQRELGSVRRLAANTLEAYGRDVDQFLTFLAGHAGGPVTLGVAVTQMAYPAVVRAGVARSDSDKSLGGAGAGGGSGFGWGSGSGSGVGPGSVTSVRESVIGREIVVAVSVDFRFAFEKLSLVVHVLISLLVPESFYGV